MRSLFASIFSPLSLLVLLVSLIGGVVQVTPARAASIVVNSNADTVAGDDGACTLREAIISAISDLPSGPVPGECAAGSLETDAISFADNYTITLGDQLPLVTTAITITGNGTANTIIQAAASTNTAQWRVFQVSPTGSLTLDQVTIRHGFCGGSCAGEGDINPEFGEFGGGIFSTGTVTLMNSTVASNEAGGGGGVYSRGTLTVTNTMITDNNAAAGLGGGIYSTGELTVANSLFSVNYADTAAGIYNSMGTLTVTNSTFSGNHAFSGSGGIGNNGTGTVLNSTFSGNWGGDGGGGGIENSGTLTVVNSTFSGNHAWTGGAINNFRTITVRNSTLVNNTVVSGYAGGGITSGNSFGGASAILENTIVAGNGGGNCSGTITNGGSNLDSGTTCGWGSGNGSLSNTDPQLSALADNGGPTQTMALLAGSPAIDTGSDAVCPSTDQRAVPRPQDGNGDGISTCDMGAYEFAFSILPIKIDIKPGSSTNPINLKARGVIPVAVLTTAEFNAATLDPATVLFAGAPPLRWSEKDVDHDGAVDLLFHFDVRKLALTHSSVEAFLNGKTLDGKEVEGKDTVMIVPVVRNP